MHQQAMAESAQLREQNHPETDGNDTNKQA
jgi:hypothetical protein